MRQSKRGGQKEVVKTRRSKRGGQNDAVKTRRSYEVAQIRRSKRSGRDEVDKKRRSKKAVVMGGGCAAVQPRRSNRGQSDAVKTFATLRRSNRGSSF